MLIAAGNFFFHWRNTLFPFACLLVLLPGERIFADPLQAAALGFVIALLGQAVRIVTIGYEYIIRGGRDRRVYAENLVTEGVYSVSRNPMYVGNLLILLGLTVSSDSWTCVAIAVPLFVFVYIAIVAAEENFLRGKFGDAFNRYCADVPRWLPGPGQLSALLKQGRFHWKRVVVKEYGTPMGWITMLMLVMLWQLRRAGLLDAHRQSLAVLLALFGVLCVAYLTVRVLKRSRRLVAD
ncbi:MAG: isoprenylcysteine carboxylmethyltransferase family protein [Nevskiaceae bacterium]|jgi:protein-S-isoprenylcysteine O-methyltransferase Ste14|nr:isoprenylcysteine carboxylmethyltransferase family protein [Nevskiaceae bacterium]